MGSSEPRYLEVGMKKVSTRSVRLITRLKKGGLIRDVWLKISTALF